MTVRGIGIDVVALAHLDAVFDDRFRDAVFTSAEIEYAESSGRPRVHYATAFAGKEAVFKALGRGWTDGPDVEVRRDGGAPRAVCSGALDGVDGEDLLLSLSHDRAYALAVAVRR